jgi:hypothetical protein
LVSTVWLPYLLDLFLLFIVVVVVGVVVVVAPVSLAHEGWK